MQDSSFEKPLVIHPANSFSLKLMVIFSHLLALLFVITLLDVFWIIKLAIAAMILLSSIYYYRWHVNKSLNQSVLSVVHLFHPHRQLSQSMKKSWSISLLKQKDLAVDLLPSSFVNVWWIVLNFKDQNNRRYTLILPYDSITLEQHRQLRVRLRVTEA